MRVGSKQEINNLERKRNQIIFRLAMYFQDVTSQNGHVHCIICTLVLFCIFDMYFVSVV